MKYIFRSLLMILNIGFLILIGIHYLTRWVDLTQPLGRVWFQYSPSSLNLTQAISERYLSPILWEGISFVLQKSVLNIIVFYFLIYGVILLALKFFRKS